VPWPIDWNGSERDFDPTDFTVRELSEIRRVAGFNGLMELITAIQAMDPDAFRAVFWTVDRRDNGDLRFGDYDGPTMRQVINSLKSLAIMEDEEEEPGKDDSSTSTTDGSPSSLNGSDTPAATMTT
jgi:hypothetical protein